MGEPKAEFPRTPNMRKNRRLLLVTDYYPYREGEQFLETEMEILRRHYSVINVVPVNLVHQHMKPHPRPIPPEVRIVDLGGISGRSATWACLPKSSRLLAQALRACRQAGVRNPIAQLSILAVTIRRCDVARRIFRVGLLDSSDAIYSYWANTTAYLLAELRAEAGTRSLRQPLVTRAHGYDLWPERSGMKRLPFQSAVIESCDRVCPCSERGAQYLRAEYPAYAGKIKAHHLGVIPQQGIAAVSSDNVLRLVTCSQLVPVKRVHLFAEAFSQLRRPASWTHFGDGPEGARLRERCAHLPGHLRVEFRGAVPNETILDFYRTQPVDLVANTSESEGIPVSIMEAFSFGVPVVATDVGGVSELVRPGMGRLMAADFRVEELTACLEEHTNESYERKRIQEWQRQAFSTANYEAFATQVLDVRSEQ